MEILDTLSTSKYDTQASPQQVLTPRGKIDYYASLKGEQDYFNLYAKLVNMNSTAIPFSEKPTQVPSRFQSEFRQQANEYSKQILADEKSIELKSEAINDKLDLLEQLRAKMRETLMRIEPKRLAQVKVDKIKGLNYLFESFFHVYYKESSEEFNWSKFKQNAVIKDQLKDFKSRLGNIDLGTLTADDKITLGKMREDRWFDAILIAQYEGGVLQQLMNYLGFINQAIKTQQEIDTLCKEVDQMRKNLVNLKTKAESCEKEDEIWETADSCFDDINEETEMSDEAGQYRKNIQLMLMKETTRTPFNTMQKLRK